jgi:hypothetical protein
MTASDLADWAGSDEARVAQLISERDAIVSRSLNGGKAINNLSSGASSGKSFTVLQDLSATEKLAVLTEALRLLGVITNTSRVVMTHGAFDQLER